MTRMVALGDVLLTTGRSGGWRLQKGARGLDLPPRSVEWHDRAGDGADFGGARWLQRDILLPLHIACDTRMALAQAMAELQSACVSGPVALTVADGAASRSTLVEYAGGLEGDEGELIRGATWVFVVLHLTAGSPWWVGETMESALLTNHAANPLYPPLLPLAPSSSRRLGEVVLSVDGSAPTWPRFIVTGPAASVEFTGPQGETFAFDAGLSATQELHVDMDPATQRVEVRDIGSPTGASAWASVPVTSSLWPLRPGAQTVTVAITGAAPETQARVEWAPRWVAA